MVQTEMTMLPIVENGKVIGEMPIELSIQCMTCSNWTQNLQCKAFPEAIPVAIWSGQHDHAKPFEGDHGILYDPIPGSPPEVTARVHKHLGIRSEA